MIPISSEFYYLYTLKGKPNPRYPKGFISPELEFWFTAASTHGYTFNISFYYLELNFEMVGFNHSALNSVYQSYVSILNNL